MVLAHHHHKADFRPTQRQLSINRFRGDSLGSAAGLPGPGVYARHNAVDVPALLPDGTPAPTSVNASLEARGDMLDYKSFDLAEINTKVEEEK
jgi:NADH-quinone oxidoreductase subunit J